MSGQHYDLLSTLPALVALDQAPPLAGSDLLGYVANHVPLRTMLEMLFLSDDLFQRQSLMAGEIDEAHCLLLTNEQAAGEEALPQCLEIDLQKDSRQQVILDHVWEAYYRCVTDVARQYHNTFLAAWAGHEVALRNALVTARAKLLNLEPEPYLVAVDLAATDVDLTPVVNEWNNAATPLDGLKVLDTHRWAWLDEHNAWFSFGDDEVVAYGAALMLLCRWSRLTAEPERTAATSA